jgi:uncharacterized membrane protein YphA (DoxX/SURF4 family)
MENIIDKLRNIPKTYSLAVPRVGTAIVFIWFGYQQLEHSLGWIGFVPKIITDNSPILPTTLVHLNGALELVFGVALLLGICTRVTSLILGLHLAHITAILPFDATVIRDFGVVMSATFITLYGPDELCLDRFLSTPEELAEKSIFLPSTTVNMLPAIPNMGNTWYRPAEVPPQKQP